MITSVGKSALARRLSEGAELDNSNDLSVVCEWDSIDGLVKLAERIEHPGMLLEAEGTNGATIGPIFAATGSVCLQCYLARRKSAGAMSCTPLQDAPEEFISFVRYLAEEFVCTGASKLDHSQVRWTSHGHETHLVVPLPDCTLCPPLVATSETLEEAVSDRVGLVTAVRMRTSRLTGLVIIEAFGCNTVPLHRHPAFNHGVAADATTASARRRAIGESIERYCASFCKREDLTTLKRAECDTVHVLPPQMLAPFQPLSGQGGEVRYSWARQVRDGTPTLVPASFVFLPYLYEPDEPQRDMQTSSGLAAGRSLEEAVERGLLELIERDAVRRAWHWEAPIVGISSSTIDIEGLQLTLINTPHPVHVVVAVIDRSDLPTPAVGFAARRKRSDAALAAALEAVAVSEFTMSRNGPEEAGRRAGMTFPCGNLDLAFTPDKWVVAEPVSADDLHPFEHQELLESVPGACFVDLTTTDVARLGASVARVLAPGLLPLPASGFG